MPSTKNIMTVQNTLFLTDLDGTLLRNDESISDYSVKTINRLTADGLKLSFATARSFSTAKKVTKNINFNIPVITNTGTIIVNPQNEEIIDICRIELKKIQEVVEIIKNLPYSPLIYKHTEKNNKEKVLWLQDKDNSGIKNYLESRKNDERLTPCSKVKTEEIFAGNIFYITFIGNEIQMAELAAKLKNCKCNDYINCHYQRDTYFPEDYWLEISRFDARKDIAAQKLKKMTNSDYIVCFGDNLNDIPMFDICDSAYAVENAKDELKKRATQIIKSNNDDGVASFLSEFFIKCIRMKK